MDFLWLSTKKSKICSYLHIFAKQLFVDSYKKWTFCSYLQKTPKFVAIYKNTQICSYLQIPTRTSGPRWDSGQVGAQKQILVKKAYAHLPFSTKLHPYICSFERWIQWCYQLLDCSLRWRVMGRKVKFQVLIITHHSDQLLLWFLHQMKERHRLTYRLYSQGASSTFSPTFLAKFDFWEISLG